MKKRINILQLVNGFDVGGAELKLLELCQLIQEKHCDRFHQVICSVGQGGPLEQRFDDLGCRTVVFNKKHAFDIGQVLGVARLMREEKINLVQTTLFYADIIGALATQIAGVPVQISWETVSHRDNVFHNKIQRRLGYRLAMKYANQIVAVSEECRQSIIQWRHVSPDRVSVIPYGVDLAKYRKDPTLSIRQNLNLPQNATVIGMVARLEPGKGHEVLLNVFGKLDPAIHLVLAGDGTIKGDLQTQARHMGIEDRVHFLGVRKDIINILNSIDLFALPSFSEGLPNSILEAMACSLPIVATHVGGIPEAIQDKKNGILIPPRNESALHQAIEVLAGDSKKRKQMGESSRLLVEQQFSLDIQLKRFLDLYTGYF